MKSISTMSLALLACLSFASAHMELTFPPPLRSKHNPFTTDIDYDMVNPLNADGSNFPCKGYLNLLGTRAASPVTTWQAGQSVAMTIGGGANHNGGSCQASLSFDGGKTFKVVKSFIGGCPTAGSSSWDFVVPADVQTKDDAIFAWTWFNRVGNREMYMNCAVVSTRASTTAQRPAVSFSSRPNIFVANVANGCSTLEGSDVQFPNPGQEVAKLATQLAAPLGNCGTSSPGGSDSTPVISPPAVTTPPVQTPSSLPGNVFLPLPTTPAPSYPITTPPSPPPAVGGEDIGAQTVWSPCRNEGVFNCVGGTRFQRCASGLWSPFISAAPGTRCKPGVRHDYIVIVTRRRGVRSTLQARRLQVSLGR